MTETATTEIRVGDRIKLPVGGTRTVESITRHARPTMSGVTHEIAFIEGGAYNAKPHTLWNVVR